MYIFLRLNLFIFISRQCMDWMKDFQEKLKFDSMQQYFMAYCTESLLQPFSNWKFNWSWRDLNPVRSVYQSNVLPTELSWLDQDTLRLWLLWKLMRLTFVESQNLPPAIFCNFTFTTQVRVLSWAIEFNFKEININIELNSRYTFGITNF